MDSNYFNCLSVPLQCSTVLGVQGRAWDGHKHRNMMTISIVGQGSYPPGQNNPGSKKNFKEEEGFFLE